MEKFLWEQRNPWNFDLYTPEEITKILTARFKSKYFPSNIYKPKRSVLNR
jgi:hypothetical protein